MLGIHLAKALSDSDPCAVSFPDPDILSSTTRAGPVLGCSSNLFDGAQQPRTSVPSCLLACALKSASYRSSGNSFSSLPSIHLEHQACGHRPNFHFSPFHPVRVRLRSASNACVWGPPPSCLTRLLQNWTLDEPV